jgi:hypothetical protein
MKYDYKDAIRRIIQGNNGLQLANDDGVFRFPSEKQCEVAAKQLISTLPEVRVYKTGDILVTTPPTN